MNFQIKKWVSGNRTAFLVVLNLAAVVFVLGFEVIYRCILPVTPACFGPPQARPGPACDSGPFLAASAVHDQEMFQGARRIFTVDADDSRLALLTSRAEDSLQIIDLSDPLIPVALKSVRAGEQDSQGGSFAALEKAGDVSAVHTESGTYALVLSEADGAVQIIDISRPDDPRALSVIDKGSYPGVRERAYRYASAVRAVQSGGRTYALLGLSAGYSMAIHIYDISRPSRPAFVAGFACDAACHEEKRCVKYRTSDIAVTTIEGRTYALATSSYGDGVQIFDISAPDQIRSLAAVSDGQDDDRGGRYTALAGAQAIDAFGLGHKAYAVVVSGDGRAVQIIDVTRPDQPLASGAVLLNPDTDSQEDHPPLNRPADIAVTTGGDGVYALVSSRAGRALYILDLSRPDEPAVLASYAGGTAGAGDISVFTSRSRTYVAAVSASGNGIEILDISDPAHITAAAFLTEGGGSSDSVTALDSPADVQTVSVAGRPYALVASYTAHGVQIIDLSDPHRPAATASITDGEKDGTGGRFTALRGLRDLAVAVIKGRTYALAASYVGNGIQIIDISDPARPRAVSVVAGGQKDSSGAAYTALAGVQDITSASIGGRTYAFAASYPGNGIQITDISDPADPREVASVTDGSQDSSGAVFSALEGVIDLTTTVVKEKTYILAASYSDDGIQIIDVSDPASPRVVSAVRDEEKDADGGAFTALNGAMAITTATADGRTYALAASYLDDGIQIIDISEPAEPRAVMAVKNTEDSSGNPLADLGSALHRKLLSWWFAPPGYDDVFTESGGATGIATATVDGRIYAFVSLYLDDAVQVIDITNPENPAPVATICAGHEDNNGQKFTALRGPTTVASADLNGAPHILVTSETDDGLQIIRFGRP